MAEFHEIAGYAVLQTLGHGARSTLYAVQGKNGNKYCLKRVVKDTPSDQRFLDQAIREHEVASQFDDDRIRRSHKLIKQRAIIRTTEVLVLMELIDGKTLERVDMSDVLKACRVIREAAKGLVVMHDAGWVHADLKPNNIMVTKDGGLKLIDFGQSCETGTVKQRIQGTPDYIAPEQVLRREITAQTDIFNLGATMYWTLTGQHVPTLIPKGQPGVQLRTDRSDGCCPPPDELNPEVPPALSTLVMDCIKTEPPQRPPDMQSVIDRLEIAALQVARKRSVDAPAGESGEVPTLDAAAVLGEKSR
jgi:serine/threonine-protein kinase